MNHPHLPIPSGKIAITEKEARRAEWTPGDPVRLADGEAWWLPRIEQSLLLVRPELVVAISRTFDAAHKVGQAELKAKWYAEATAVYHSQLVRLGVTLLRENYDLPPECWRRLTSFKNSDACFRLTLGVSDAMADSILNWFPLYVKDSHNEARNPICN